MSVVVLAVSSVYLGSRKFFIAANEKVIIAYELQYACRHIYKYTMQAMGDETSPPDTSAVHVPDVETVNININENDPLTSSNYASVTTYRYYKSGNALMFDRGTPLDSSDDESLIPKVTVNAVTFAKSDNTLTGCITATYGAQSQTFYFACYPRMATFH